jgi:hypothetical protein
MDSESFRTDHFNFLTWLDKRLVWIHHQLLLRMPSFSGELYRVYSYRYFSELLKKMASVVKVRSIFTTIL